LGDIGRAGDTRKQFHISARFLIVLVCIERGPGALQLARKKEMINVLHHESLLLYITKKTSCFSTQKHLLLGFIDSLLRCQFFTNDLNKSNI
jgi:hypothetical protein